MKNITFIYIVFLFLAKAYCQDNYDFKRYFEGKYQVCATANKKSYEHFYNGMQLLKLNYKLDKKYLMINVEMFAKSVEEDTTFCDAYFFTGYTLSLMNMQKEALTFYYAADSLSNNSSILYKVNLASTAIKIGAVELARQKYEELIQHFAYSPEGYYGVALTSTMIGDVDNGLQHIDRAIELYDTVKDDAKLIKAMLLCLNKKYEEALPFFKAVRSTFKNKDDYKMLYSYSLLKTSQDKGDTKMGKQALKLYEKIKDKDKIPAEYAEAFDMITK